MSQPWNNLPGASNLSQQIIILRITIKQTKRAARWNHGHGQWIYWIVEHGYKNKIQFILHTIIIKSLDKDKWKRSAKTVWQSVRTSSDQVPRNHGCLPFNNIWWDNTIKYNSKSGSVSLHLINWIQVPENRPAVGAT